MLRYHPDLLRKWRTQAAHVPKIELVEDADADLTELMLRSDVLVSDVSSVAFSYLALDRPIVCYRATVEELSSPYYAPDGIEGRLREAADICSRETLAEAVRRALAKPEARSADRKKLAEYLFGKLRDGHAGIRIARQIATLLRHHA